MHQHQTPSSKDRQSVAIWPTHQRHGKLEKRAKGPNAGQLEPLMNPTSKFEQSWKFYFQFTGLAVPPTWLFFTLMTWLYPFEGWPPQRGIATSALFCLFIMALVMMTSFITRLVSKTRPVHQPYFIASFAFAQFLISRTSWRPFQELPGAILLSLLGSAVFQVCLLYSIVGFLKRQNSIEKSKELADPEWDARMT